MAKFGLFSSTNATDAKAEFEGEYLETTVHGGAVAVAIVRADDMGAKRTFAVVRLAEGYIVRELKA